MLRSVGDARSTFLVNTVLGPLMLTSIALGMALGGVRGAAWGFACATTLVIPLFWMRMENTLRRIDRGLPLGRAPRP